MTNTATTPSGQPLGISHKPSATEAMFDRLKAETSRPSSDTCRMASQTPTSHSTRQIMVEHGVDAVEIGLPYPTR